MSRSLLCLASLVAHALAACIDMDVGLGSSATWTTSWGDVPMCDDMYLTKVEIRDTTTGAVTGYNHSLGAQWCEQIAGETIDHYKTITAVISDWTYYQVSGTDMLIDTWCGRTCAMVGVQSSGTSEANRAACDYCMDMDVGLGESSTWTAWGAWESPPAGAEYANCTYHGTSAWCTQNSGITAGAGAGSYRTLTFGEGQEHAWAIPTHIGDSANFIDTFCGASCGKFTVGSCNSCVDLDIGLDDSTIWTTLRANDGGSCAPSPPPTGQGASANKGTCSCGDYLKWSAASLVIANHPWIYPAHNRTGLDGAAAKLWCEANQLTTLDTFKSTNGLTDWTYPSYVSGTDLLVQKWCGHTCARVGVGTCSTPPPPSIPPQPRPPPSPPPPPAAPSPDDKGFPVGAIIGIVLGAIVLVVALGFLVWILTKKKPVAPTI